EAPIELSSAGADPSLSVNARGDTAAVWVEIPGVIVGRSFSAQNPTTWSDPVPLTNVTGGNAFEPKVAIQPGGLVIVVWTKIQDASLWSTAGRIE
ncbi:MAG: hypothetical protein GY807_21570, partial [Gammaproteobacteria bacterium]|nr:hypothetical protein [Gammaproteobacteria bacterium]